jgi:hypothetical protein
MLVHNFVELLSPKTLRRKRAAALPEKRPYVLLFKHCHPLAPDDRMRPMRRATLSARMVGIPRQELGAAPLEMRRVRLCI